MLKSEIEEKPTKSTDCALYKSTTSGVVIMASAGEKYLKGIVVAKGGAYQIGYYSEDWATDIFRPFYGSVTITNE